MILSALEILPLEFPADREYDAIRHQLTRQGAPIGPNNLLIAAHALACNLTLVTANVGEFSRVPGLKVKNWLPAQIARLLSTQRPISQTWNMTETKPRLYLGYRFPPEIISHAMWLYHRFCISFRDVEDLLAERGILVSYASIRSWCNKFGPAFARSIKKRRGAPGDTGYMNEVYFVTVREERRFWHAP